MLAIPTLAHSPLPDLPRSESDPKARSGPEDPIVLARRWEAMGFQRLHLRELDGADRRLETADLVRELVRQHCLPFQVESVAADDTALEEILDLGADLVIRGARGTTDPGWLATKAARAPGRISIAVDLRGGRMLPRGREPRRDLFDLLDELAAIPLASVMIAAAASTTPLQPADLTRLEEVVSRVAWPVVALDAVVSLVELRNLEERGVSAAVLAATWDHEALDPRVIAEEFAV